MKGIIVINNCNVIFFSMFSVNYSNDFQKCIPMIHRNQYGTILYTEKEKNHSLRSSLTQKRLSVTRSFELPADWKIIQVINIGFSPWMSCAFSEILCISYKTSEACLSEFKFQPTWQRFFNSA